MYMYVCTVCMSIQIQKSTFMAHGDSLHCATFSMCHLGVSHGALNTVQFALLIWLDPNSAHVTRCYVLD